MTLFDDFWIHIGPPDASQDPGPPAVSPTGALRVTVIHSPAGNATGKLDLPFAISDAGDRLTRLEQTLRDSIRAASVRDFSPRGMSAPPSKDLGLSLYRALFTGDVRSCFDESYGRAAERQRVLRIRLHIELDHPDCRRVASLPWEMLWHPEKRQSLALSKQTTITRYLPVAQPAEPRAFQPPLRILFVSANPHGDLNLDEERATIQKRLAEEKGACESDVVDAATYSALSERLGEDYHVIHFMGHGGFNGEEGVLFLHDGEVSGTRLGNLVANQRKTNLVVLNACRTAEFPRQNGRDPFAGVASALVAAGVPAVVAMQFPISDQAAIHFAARFYSQIAQGRSIEEALLAGRQRVESISPTDEWATPVLMLRGESPPFRPSAAAVDGDPQERHKAAEELDDDSLLPFMADRTDLIFELSEAIREQDAKPNAPLVSIVHGDDKQCQDMLEKRLNRVELPKRLESRTGIKIYRMEWPREFQGADQFRRKLTWSFADSARPNADLAALIDYIDSFPAPVMVCSQVLASEWKRLGGEAALEAYIDWWDAWGARARTTRIFAFLSIKYETGSGWFGKRTSNRINDAIASKLSQLKTAKPGSGNFFLRVLPQLEGVDRQDVDAWNAAHGRPLAEEEIRQLYVTWKTETNQDTMPMVEIARRLRELLERTTSPVEVLT